MVMRPVDTLALCCDHSELTWMRMEIESKEDVVKKKKWTTMCLLIFLMVVVSVLFTIAME